MIWSPQSTLPLLVHRADAVGVAVVGDADVGALVSSTFAFRCSRFFSTVGSGWWFGNRPSISMKSGTTSIPSDSKSGTATTPPVPLPASTTTLSLRSPSRRFSLHVARGTASRRRRA